MSPPLYVDSATCPHCGGLGISCCVCQGVGTLPDFAHLAAAVANVWARKGCTCTACTIAGPKKHWPVQELPGPIAVRRWRVAS